MNKQTVLLGRILGISIRLNYSWFLIFALLTWMLAVAYFPFEVALPTAVYWILGALTAMLFFASVLLHELGHSVVARRYRVPVRRITLFIFGGVAEIGSEPPSARAEFLIALAGPIVSFGLAALFGVLALGASQLAPLFVLAKYLALINGSLALFNLIPGFPLDGGRVFRAIVWSLTGSLSRATRIAVNLGRVIAFLFIAFGVWQVLNGNLGGLWLALIGWFLQDAASQQLEQQELHDLLAHHPVAEAMNHGYVAVPGETTLQQVVDQHLVNVGARAFVVQRDDKELGLLTWHSINAVPQTEWRTTTAAQAMIPAAQMKSIRPDAELWSAVEEMGRDHVDELPVVAEGHPLGILRREDVTTFLRRLRLLKAS